MSDPSSASDLVRLNVGGVIFVTTRATLLKGERSFFHGLLDGRFAPPRDADGALFIDRDGDLFRPILQYLRSGEWRGSPDALAESRFYGINPTVFESLTDQHLREYFLRGTEGAMEAAWGPHVPAIDDLVARIGTELKSSMDSLMAVHSSLPSELCVGYLWVSLGTLEATLDRWFASKGLDPECGKRPMGYKPEQQVAEYHALIRGWWSSQSIVESKELYPLLQREGAPASLQSFLKERYKLSVLVIPQRWAIEQGPYNGSRDEVCVGDRSGLSQLVGSRSDVSFLQLPLFKLSWRPPQPTHSVDG